MKLSLAWIFDHLKESWKDHDIPALMHRFSTVTAEIDYYTHSSLDLTRLTLAKITEITEKRTIVYSAELHQKITLPSRPDVSKDQCLLLAKHEEAWKWATEKDFNGVRDELLPALYVPESLQDGSWKKTIEKEDIIITIDNIALTHRPDLWSHRGIAREIGALLGIPLVAEQEFLDALPIKKHEQRASLHQDDTTFEIALEVPESLCKRFAALYIPSISCVASPITMAHRLLRIDARPLNAIIDATNYVMFDWGQPLHAFDAQTIAAKQLFVRQALAGQHLTLLDEQEITLTDHDIIISDGKKPLALAGIMGGKETAITPKTTSILLEAASFNASTIRTTAKQHKLRTEASTRFEKNIDPQNNVPGLLRFLNILSTYAISFSMPQEVVSLGQEVQPHSIDVEHTFIERLLGVYLHSDFVNTVLTSLAFVVRQEKTARGITYHVQVPTFRGTKDILIPEDVVEEIGRFFGFDNIPKKLPALTMKPSNLPRFYRTNLLKQFFSTAAASHEVQNYALYDEEFLQRLAWEPAATLAIKNPVSSSHYRLVTSLIPHLLKNVHTNATHKGVYNFFEVNKIWDKNVHNIVVETISVGGIFFDAVNDINFYEQKELLSVLFSTLKLEVVWEKATMLHDPWYHPHQTALLRHGNIVLGYAGMANPALLEKIMPGTAFVFELNGDVLFTAKSKEIHFKPLPKFQDAWRDISMLLPLSYTVQEITAIIKQVSPAIIDVELVDFFQKEEWHDVRSITMRFFVRNEEKTLVTEEIDALYNEVVAQVTAKGATIR